MKRLLFAVLLLFTSLASVNASELNEVREVLKFVETKHTPDAIGDNGASWGILQIQKGVIEDVNRVYGTVYRHQDAFDIACAEEIFDLYISIWSSHLEKKEGRKATVEDIVRIWNGGPKGYKKKSTLDYLAKYEKTSYLYSMAKNQQKCIINGKLGIVTAKYTHTVDVYIFKDKREMCGVHKKYVKLLPKENKPDPAQLQFDYGQVL